MQKSELLRSGAQAGDIQTYIVRQMILIGQDISVLAGHQYYTTFNISCWRMVKRTVSFYFQSMGLIHKIPIMISCQENVVLNQSVYRMQGPFS